MSAPRRLERLAMRSELKADIENRFSHHSPDATAIKANEDIRAEFKTLAHIVAEKTPPGRHQSLALTALQEGLMWANAAIACDTKPAGRPVRDSPQA